MFDDVEEIKNDSELSEYYKEYSENKDPRVIKEILKYLKSGKANDIAFKIEYYSDITDYEDEDGKTLFHYLIEYKFKCCYEITNFLANSMQALWDFLDMNPTDLFLLDHYSNEETFFKKLPNGEVLFDYLISTKRLNGSMVCRISKHPEVLDKINNYDKKLLNYLSEDTLFNTTINSSRTIDYIFKEGIANSTVVSKIMFHEEIIDIINNYNRKDLLKYVNECILVKQKDNKTYLEILLDEGVVPETNYSRKDTLKVLFERGIYYRLLDRYEFVLLQEIYEGKTLLECLLEKGLTPTNNYYDKEQAILIMFKYNRFDLMVNCKLDLLLTKVDKDGEITYLDLILNEMKYGLPISLSKISNYSEDVENTAMFYIKVARSGLYSRLLQLDPVWLVTNRPVISVLDAMISIDKDITLNVILNKNLREYYPIATYLKMHGYENPYMEVKLFEENNLTDKYYEGVLEPYKDIKLSEEDEELLERFRYLMLDDELSVEKYVDLVVLNYRRLLSENHPYARLELIKLCELKEKVPEFKIIETGDYETPFYRHFDRSVHLSTGSLDTLNHEMGHALYHNYTDLEVPDEFYQIIKEIREDKTTMDRLRKISNYYQEQQEKISRMVKDYVDSFYQKEYDLDRLENQIYFASEDKKEELLKYGYSEEDIEALFDTIYTTEEYQKEAKRINTEELTDAVIRTRLGGLIGILDIIDGIYTGKYRSGELVDNHGFPVPSAYGHGVAYYEREIKWVFDETMANYSAISKSPNSKEGLALLRELVGERFINCIESFYIDSILNSTKELKGKGL